MMTNKTLYNHDEDYAVKSSDSVAFLRALSTLEKDKNLQSPDYMAQYFISNKYKMLLKPSLLWGLKKIIEHKYPGSYFHVVARAKHFDKHLLEEVQNGIEQFVIIGAGCDTRAYRFKKQLSNINIFELDYPGTQKVKINNLKKNYNKFPQNIKYVPIDLNTDSLENTLMDNGFDINKKTFFIMEGVSMYIKPDAINKILFEIRNLSPAKNRFLFDYAYLGMIEGRCLPYGGLEMLKHGQKKKEPYIFGIEQGESETFLRERGFSVIHDIAPKEIVNEYLTTEKGTIGGRIHEYIQFCLCEVMDIF